MSDIAVDTIARVAPSDSNDEREQVAVFAVLARALELAPAGSVPPTVWAVAHTRKNSGNELADVSGSVQRTGQADTVILVRGEKNEGRTVSTTATFMKLREDPDDYPLPATYSIVRGREGTSEIAYTDKQNDDRPLETRITELLRMAPSTKTSLCTALGRSDAAVEQALSNLFATKAIRTTTVKVRGRDRKGFELRNDWKPPAPTEDLGAEFDGHL